MEQKLIHQELQIEGMTYNSSKRHTGAMDYNGAKKRFEWL